MSAHPSQRPGRIVWLASVPKSGNTWLRLVLTALASGGAEKNPLKSVGFFSSFNNPEFFTDLFDDKRDSPADIMKQWLPAQKRLHENESNRLRFIKTHNMSAEINGHWFTKPEFCAAILHIIRDPRDLPFSMASHFQISAEAACDWLLTDKYMLREEGVITEFVGSWATHTRSWEAMEIKRAVPRLVLRFEDMIREPEAQIMRIVKLFGFSDNAQAIKAAVEATRFDKLKAQEAKDGFSESVNGVAFFRSGRSGEGRMLPPGRLRQIETAFAPVMQDYGYAPYA